jgi:hypothetical protein
MLGASVTPKLFLPEIAGESMDQLGWPRDQLPLIAAIELISTVLFAIPRTSVMGAVLLTGVFGGATATHLRVGNPLFSHVLFPVILGAIMWAGLLLRDPALRSLLARTSATKATNA